MSSTGGTTQDRDENEESEDGGQYVDSDYESSSDGQRAGRFYGPDSSWRYYTQDERALASSLQRVENDDLSLALYNVHAMKSRARGRESISSAKPWHSKGSWIQPDQDGRLPFQPPPKWTAWPLKPRTVPRTREIWGASAVHPDVAAETYTKPEPWKPSLNLQEELKAGFLRQAKNRFHKRQWEDGFSHAPLQKPASRSHQSSSDVDKEDFEMHDQDQTEPLPEDARLRSASLSTPLFLADDDVASAILQPTVRHIISKQDDLLAALHRSRRGHRLDHIHSTKAKRKTQGRPGPANHTHQLAKSTSKRKRVASNTLQPDSKILEEREVVSPSSKPARKLRGQYRRLPGQRDWSEILGVAAMSGWDQSTIDRATRRCTAIFGETMSMRYMAEASTGHTQDRVVEYVPDMIPTLEMPMETQDEELIEEAVNVCPHVSCTRHTEPYEYRWRLREHLKKHHNYTQKELDDWKLQAIERDRHSRKIESSKDDEEDDDQGNAADASAFKPMLVSSERNDFLQPITVRIGRSRDIRPRASKSRSQSQKATGLRASNRGDADVVGTSSSGSAVSTDSEL